MSLTPTYPGIYIQELPSGNRTITPVATSITAFIGSALRGPIDSDHDSPVVINSFGDFQQIFGGLWKQEQHELCRQPVLPKRRFAGRHSSRHQRRDPRDVHPSGLHMEARGSQPWRVGSGALQPRRPEA